MSLFTRFLDRTAEIRNTGEETRARVLRKEYTKDAGLGDSPMFIEYEFMAAGGTRITGNYHGTESSFYGLEIGDEILVRYLEYSPETNAPVDAIGVIRAAA